jgi:hypothetical protein
MAQCHCFVRKIPERASRNGQIQQKQQVTSPYRAAATSSQSVESRINNVNDNIFHKIKNIE